MGIFIRIKPGHQLAGEGERLGKDSTGENHTFWKSMGHMEIPRDLAIKLEKERPQRFEIVNRDLAKKVLSGAADAILPKPRPTPPPVAKVSLKRFQDMTKDELNDWAAKNDYDVNPSRQKKQEMINVLVKQIEKRTGNKVV